MRCCDMCNKELRAKYVQLDLSKHEYYSNPLVGAKWLSTDPVPWIDLCEDCLTKVCDFIDNKQ